MVIKSRDASIYFDVLRHVFITLNDSGGFQGYRRGHPSALCESFFCSYGNSQRCIKEEGVRGRRVNRRSKVGTPGFKFKF